MEPLTRHALVGALKDAYDCMKLENMSCPWCSGRICWNFPGEARGGRVDGDEHNEFCIYHELKEEFAKVE